MERHTINYSGNLIIVTGVKEVREFSDTEVDLVLEGNTLALFGKGLAVSELVIKDGRLAVNGELCSLSYGKGGEKVPFFKRLFK